MNKFIIFIILFLGVSCYIAGFDKTWELMTEDYLWVTLVAAIGIPLYYLTKHIETKR
jgi:hypothetical protein